MSGRIEDYAVVGDLQTMALVGRDGSIDWLCLPRFDSPACFAALLDTEQAGRWQLAPARGGVAVRRRYRGDTLVLESEWDTADGSVRVVDCMPPRGEAADVVRVVEGLSGEVPMRMSLRLRFDYGHIVPWVRHHGHSFAAIAGPDAMWLHTQVPLHGRDGTITQAQFTVRAGQRVSFVLTHQRSHLPAPQPVDADRAIAETEQFWAGWINHCTYTGRWSAAVRRSLILLKALTYAPTGGIVAAATTSLPEQIGGPRNWDYRYCWLRDATFTLQALLGTGFVAEAQAWREWLLRAVAGDPADLRIMYGLDGTRRLPEYTLDWLAGYQDSHPVRVGNGAAEQLQLDVWGEVLDGLHLSREAGLAPSEAAWDLQQALLDFLEGNWKRPDNSLWEVRGPRRQFVHSKVLAWVAFDRAVTAVHHHGLDGPVGRWQAIRDQIHAEVCAKGFDSSRNTFTQFYGSAGAWTPGCCSSRGSGFCHRPTRGCGALSTRSSRSYASTDSSGATTRKATTTSMAYPAPRALSWLAASGWSTPCTRPAAPGKRRSCSNGSWPYATTSASSPRNTTRPAAGTWATPRRRSALSVW
jgi:GH15 family glucan-1,4-alpha-glucosidase